MQPIFFDTETTGGETKDRLCQLAWKTGGSMRAEYFNPPLPISIDAMAVHHITQKMVDDKPLFKDSPIWKEVKDIFESDTHVPVAHNAKFDLDMLKKEEIFPKQYICTLKVARELDTDGHFPRYGLQYLRYSLGIEIESIAHSADGDVLVLEQLFDRLLKKMLEKTGDMESAINEMIAISARPCLMKNFNFGKHIGKTIAEVAQQDPGYLEWLLKSKLENSPDDEDWIYTLRVHLGKDIPVPAPAPTSTPEPTTLF